MDFYSFNKNVVIKNKISVRDYAALRKTADWKDIGRRQAAAGLRNSIIKINASIGGKTVGMARVVGDGGYVMLIVDVVVLPEYRGKGIGTLMMEALMERIHNFIRDGEGAMVQLMSAKGRENFYARFGFKARPTNDLGAGMSQWIGS